MRRTTREKTSIKGNLLFSFVVFVVSYICVSCIIWGIQKTTLQGGIGIKKSLSAYVRTHGSQLQTSVFHEAFDKAVRCQEEHQEITKEQCITEVKTDLGNSIQEEELAGAEGFMWPNDLFFVKEVDGTYLKLGWDGVVQNITPEVTLSVQNSPEQIAWSLITRENCNYFHSGATEANSACEIYATTPLANGGTGYMVRLDPQEEEDDFSFVLLLPIISLPLLCMSSFRVDWILYAIVPLLQILVPGLIVLFVVWANKKK